MASSRTKRLLYLAQTIVYPRYPHLMKHYNRHMGGADLARLLVALCRNVLIYTGGICNYTKIVDMS